MGPGRDAERAIDHAPFGVVTIDTDGRVMAVNHTLAAMLNVASEEIVGRSFVAFVSEHDRGSLHRALADLRRGRRRAVVEHRLDATGPEPTWCRSTLIRDGESGGTLVYVEDVSERRLAVLALRETERQFRAAFEGAPVGQAVCTLDGLILHANRTLARILGVDVASLHGSRLNDHALDRSPVSEDDLIDLVRGSVASIETERRFRHASDQTVHAQVHLTLRRDRAGQPSELLVAVTDITRRTLAEQDRARALTRLRDALEDVERSNADLEHFASVASHDLSTPLSTVIGLLRTLDVQERERLTARGRTLVGAALRGAERMGSMLESLLEYARRNHEPLEVEPIDLRELVSGVLDALGPSIDQAGATVDVGPLPVIEADRASLDIVYQNLIANAVKFARADIAPRIRLHADHVGDTWHLIVEDNGSGVAPDQREAIFELFERPGAPSPRGGLGIGLATVARAVKRHGGRVWVEDRPAGGSRFVVALPSGDDAHADAAASTPAVSRP